MPTGSPFSKVMPLILAAFVLTTLSCSLLTGGNSPDQPASTADSPSQAIVPSAPQPVKTATGAPPATAPEQNANCLVGIKPGSTTRQEVLTRMGEPAANEQKYGLEILSYASSMQGQFHTILLKDQVVTRVVRVLDEDQIIAWSAQKASLGEPAFTAYSDFLPGSMAYAYPDMGLMFIADENMDAVFILECFVPMSLGDFQKTYGAVLSSEDIFSR